MCSFVLVVDLAKRRDWLVPCRAPVRLAPVLAVPVKELVLDRRLEEWEWGAGRRKATVVVVVAMAAPRKRVAWTFMAGWCVWWWGGGVLELEAVKRKGVFFFFLPVFGRRGGGDRR